MSAKRRRLTVKAKFNISPNTWAEDATVGEILREYGLHPLILKKIEEAVEEGAIANFKTKSSWLKE